MSFGRSIDNFLQFLIAGEWQQNFDQVPKRFLGLKGAISASLVVFLYSLIFKTGANSSALREHEVNLQFFTSRCNLNVFVNSENTHLIF